MSFFVISEVLGLFVRTVTADDCYYLLNWKNLQQPIQMQLSKEVNFFPQLFAQFLKSTSNFKHFEKIRWSS